MTVLIRLPSCVSAAILSASITQNSMCLSCSWRCTLPRQVVPDLVRAVGAVEQEGRPVAGDVEDVHALEQVELVAGDEVGVGDEIGGVDRLWSEAQVRGCHGARLLRVVDEVALHEVLCRVDDDLGTVLVRPYGAVRAETEEDGLHLGGGSRGAEVLVPGKAERCHIVVDADCEVALRPVGLGARRARPWPWRG